jgi:uncharacterized SAM-binding protein YcdF (DUF218 family)
MFGLNYLLYKALALFIMPLGSALIVLITAAVLLLFKKRKTTLVLIICLVAWLWLWSTPVWCNFLCGRLESKFTWKPAAAYPVADAIVSLGGGIRGSTGLAIASQTMTDPIVSKGNGIQGKTGPAITSQTMADTKVSKGSGAQGNAGLAVAPDTMDYLMVSKENRVNGKPEPSMPSFDLGSAADRELFAAQLYHAGKSKKIIVTAGVDPVMGTGVAALAQKEFLEMLKVPPAAILVEGRSLNTIDNAREVKRLLEPVKGKSILLVTSAMHMPRAYWLFARTGLRVIPAPTDFEVVKSPITLMLFLPDAGALDASTRAAREMIGLSMSKLVSW